MTAFVGIETAPVQRINNIFFGAGDITTLVSIFDAKNEFAVVMAGDGQIQQWPWVGARVQPEVFYDERRVQRKLGEECDGGHR